MGIAHCLAPAMEAGRTFALPNENRRTSCVKRAERKAPAGLICCSRTRGRIDPPALHLGRRIALFSLLYSGSIALTFLFLSCTWRDRIDDQCDASIILNLKLLHWLNIIFEPKSYFKI